MLKNGNFPFVFSFQLQVSDGKDSSDARTLLVQAVPLELRLVANSGIVIQPGGGGE